MLGSEAGDIGKEGRMGGDWTGDALMRGGEE